jgi:site-specific DNA-methyltransferase (cytosine-N4-specific)
MLFVAPITEKEMNQQNKKRTAPYHQSQLLLPVVEAIESFGRRATTQAICSAVAERIELDPLQRARRGAVGSAKQEINLFDRDVRWAQQRARLQGLICRDQPNTWSLTDKGRRSLTSATPGLVVTIFVTDSGAALWANCEDAVGLIDDGSTSLIFSSPPYPLVNQKAYGHGDVNQYIDWLLRIMDDWPRKLAHDGSIVLNLGDAWVKGTPFQSTYQERLIVKLEDSLGLRLCQRFAWHNPAALPSPAEWVNVRRIRVKSGMENLWWLSPNDNPYANNREVLQPYSEAMKKLLGAGQTRGDRPSGHQMQIGAFATDNGGSIPSSLIVAANTESNSRYIRNCKAAGLPVHPARFPKALPEFFIKLTTRPGDQIVDFFGGSGTTAIAAEELGRRWITVDAKREYVEGHRLRFPNCSPSF